ncbi:hypothetical protein AKJ16_DCAP01572 [Drosera capensis]
MASSGRFSFARHSSASVSVLTSSLDPLRLYRSLFLPLFVSIKGGDESFKGSAHNFEFRENVLLNYLQFGFKYPTKGGSAFVCTFPNEEDGVNKMFARPCISRREGFFCSASAATAVVSSSACSSTAEEQAEERIAEFFYVSSTAGSAVGVSISYSLGFDSSSCPSSDDLASCYAVDDSGSFSAADVLVVDGLSVCSSAVGSSA